MHYIINVKKSRNCSSARINKHINRLFVIFKNFPLLDLLRVPYYAMSRYFWHFIYALRGQGKAAEFQRESGGFIRLPWYVVRGHLELLGRFPAIWRQRRGIKRRLTTKQFRRLIRRYSISPRQVAAL